MRLRALSTRSMVLIGISAATAACATPSMNQVAQFGMASSSLGDHARQAFQLADSASVDRNLFDVAADPKKGPTDGTFQGLFTGNSGNPQKAERLAVRLQVLDELVDYSSALQRLAEANFSTEIDEATTDLNGALVGLRGTYKKASGKDLPISDADLGIIATAVNAIGKAVAEKKRREAIKEVITRADPAVQSATTLIAQELGQSSDLAQFVAEALSNSRGSIQQAYNLARVRMTFDERYALLIRAKQLYDAELATPSFFAAVSEGSAATGKAHSALRKAVVADDFGSAEVATLIGDLQVYAKSVRTFQKTLQSTE